MPTIEVDPILYSAQAQSERTTHEPKISRTLDLIAPARGDKAKETISAEAAARAMSQEETFLNVMNTFEGHEGLAGTTKSIEFDVVYFA